MARLSDIEGKSLDEVRGGAYSRCFGDVEFSRLLSRVQSLIIRNGLELEKLIADLVQPLQIHDLDRFLSAQIMFQGVRVATKKVVKNADTMQGRNIEPDLIIFERKRQTQNCYIVELKDGHEFDTKSSAKEHDSLSSFLSKNADALQFYQTYIRICGFNARSRQEIETGFKNKFHIDQTMTGRELCALLGVDYEYIVERRAADKYANYNQFLDDLIDIDSVRSYMLNKLDR